MIIIKCDKCEQLMNPNCPIDNWTIKIIPPPINNLADQIYPKEKHLCPKCIKKLNEWFKNK